MMKNYDQLVEINLNPNQAYIPDHSYRILIIGGSGSGKTNMLLNVIKNQRMDIDKIYLYVKDPFESKYQLFLNGREKVGTEKIQRHSLTIHKQLMMFMKISKTIIQQRKREFNSDTIADMESNKN